MAGLQRTRPALKQPDATLMAPARAFAVREAWKQPVTVDNRPGAGGQIGTQAVVKADVDGYTLLVQSASHAANPAIYKALPCDPRKDLLLQVPEVRE